MNQELNAWSEVVISTGQEVLANLLIIIPKFIGAVLVIFIGWIISKIISKLVFKFLKKSKFDSLIDNTQVGEVFGGDKLHGQVSKYISKTVYWVLFLIFFMSGAKILGWTMITDLITQIIEYIPKVFMAIIIFTIGTYMATFIRDVIKTTTKSLGLSTGSFIANIVFYFLLVIVSITALDQAGIETSLISSNLILIIGAILIAGSIAYGFAAKDIMGNILSTFFAKRAFKLGQEVSVGDVRGEIIDMSSISITLWSNDQKIVIPTKKFISDNVTILKDID